MRASGLSGRQKWHAAQERPVLPTWTLAVPVVNMAKPVNPVWPKFGVVGVVPVILVLPAPTWMVSVVPEPWQIGIEHSAAP